MTTIEVFDLKCLENLKDSVVSLQLLEMLEVVGHTYLKWREYHQEVVVLTSSRNY